MKRIRFTQFSILFILLIGFLSINVAIHHDDTPIVVVRDDSSVIVQSPIVDDSACFADQEIELDHLIWHVNYTISGNDFGVGLVECKDGNYCIAGALNISSNYWRATLIKIDPSGHQIWNQTYVHANATSASSLVCCSDGGFALTGEFRNDTFMGRDGTILIKTNSTGHPQWNVTFLDMLLFHDILQTDDGCFILLGIGKSLYGYEYDIILTKTDENGTILWTKNYGMFDMQEGYSIVECSSGGYAIAGWVYSYSASIYETFLMRITEAGDLLWFRTYGTDVISGGTTVLECTNGDFLIGGSSGMLKTDSDGNPKSFINLYGYVYDAILFDDSRIAVAQSGVVRCTDKNQTLVQSYLVGFQTRKLVRCINGEFIVVGQKSNDINAARVPWLDWNETPSDILVEYTAPLSLNLNATCSQAIDSWSVNDTAHFTIDSQGVLTNTGILDIGEYPLEIVVNDTLGNQLIQRFTVTVEDTTAPTWLQEPGTVFLEAGDAFYCDLNATDVSGTLVWSLAAPYTFEITQTGVITNIAELTVGTYLIEVQVQDTSGNTLTGTVTLQVEDNQAPVYIIPPESFTISYGHVIEFDVVAYDFSGIDVWIQNNAAFNVLISTNGPVSTARFTSNGILSPDIYYIELNVTDTYGNNLSTDFSITVLSSSTTTAPTTSTTTQPTTTTTSLTTTEGVLDSTQILLLGLGSGIGGAVLVIIIYTIIKRR